MSNKKVVLKLYNTETNEWEDTLSTPEIDITSHVATSATSTTLGHVKVAQDLSSLSTQHVPTQKAVVDGINSTIDSIQTYTEDQISALSSKYSPITHSHTIAQVSGLQDALDNKASKTVASTTSDGLMSIANVTKLNGIAASAEVNQNAFSNVIVGSTTITADTKTDTLTLVAGSNVTLTPDATNDKITIASTNTTYSTASSSVDGLLSKTDKAKLDGIAAGANKYTLPVANASTIGGVKAGTNITIATDGTISSANTVYTHPTGDGNLHVPATSTTNNGKVLKAGATAGSLSWGTLSKSDVGLGNVDNTSDTNKPISSATQTALNAKLSKTSVTTVTDLNTFKTSGIYSLNFTGGTNQPTSSWGTLFVEADMGTPYQIYICDGAVTTMYKRSFTSAGVFSAWVEMKLTDTTYVAATTSANGLMTSAMVTKLNGIATGANNYSLPTATASVLGGVKTGTNITNSSGTISVANASTSVKGVVQLNDTLTSTSTSLAATANSVKVTNDLINKAVKNMTTTTSSLDLSTATLFYIQPTAATTISFTGTPISHTFTIAIKQGTTAYSVSFPSNIVWETSTSFNETGTVYFIEMTTVDNGAKWYGNFRKKFYDPYELAVDADFSGSTNGSFKYIGTKTMVEIPHTIKGVAVTSYTNMFEGNTNVVAVKSTNKNVTNMSRMFYNSKVTKLDLRDLDTSNVTTLSYMFYGMTGLTSLNLSNFNTSKVTTMSFMFYSTTALTTLNVTHFDTSKVTDMSYMFYLCGATSLNVSNFNTSNVTSMSYMFNGSKTTALNLSNFNTSKVTSMTGMFDGCRATSLNLSSFNTSNVTRMNEMFNGSYATTINISSFDTSKATRMASMFRDTVVPTLNLSHFNTSNVTDMSNMFRDCAATTINVSSFNTANVDDMSGMFWGVVAPTLNLSNFDTSNVIDMGTMFSGATSTSINVTSFNTTSVEDMSRMFEDCQVPTLDLSSFDMTNVLDTDDMFDEAVTTKVYARTSADATILNATTYKPSTLVVSVK